MKIWSWFGLNAEGVDKACKSNTGFGAEEVAAGGGKLAGHTPTLSAHPSLIEISYTHSIIYIMHMIVFNVI